MLCPGCGLNNPAGSKFCGECGRALSSDAPAPQYYPPPPQYYQQHPQPAYQQPPQQNPGQPVYMQNVYHPGQAGGTYVPSHLGLALMSMLCCCFPLGIVSLIYSTQVNGKLNAGDVAGAHSASSSARLWAIIGIICGLISNGIIALIYGGAIFAALIDESSRPH